MFIDALQSFFSFGKIRSRNGRGRTFKPELFMFEARLAPATYTWNGAAGANWSVSTNWLGGVAGQVPGPADTVIFGGTTGANTDSTMDLRFGVTSGGGQVFAHIGKLDIKSNFTGTIACGNKILIVNALDMAGGKITSNTSVWVNEQTGNPNFWGATTIFETSNWTGGTINVGRLNIYGEDAHRETFQIAPTGDPAVLDSAMTINEYATVNWTSGNVTVMPGVTVVNNGTFLMDGGMGTLGNTTPGAGNEWTFENNGVRTFLSGTTLHIRYTNPNGTGRFTLRGTLGSLQDQGTFDQSTAGIALTEVDSGTYQVTGTFTQTAGDLTVKGGTTLALGSDFTEGAGASLNIQLTTPGSGSGLVTVAGTVTLDESNLNVTALPGFSGSQFTLISNTGGSDVAGTFAGLPEGAALMVGRQAFTISYFGGSGQDVVLTAASSPITLASSAVPIYDGQSVTFTASLPTNATGSVDFYDNGSYLGSGTISGGIATYSTSALAVGSHVITASYAGDDNNSACSINLAQTVFSAPTVIGGGTEIFTVGTGNSVTLSTNGSPLSTFSQTGDLPDGVTFTDNGDGTATISGTPALGTVGTYSLTLTVTDNGVTGSPQTFTTIVAKADTTTTFGASSATSAVVGEELTLSASVDGGGSGTPTGTVTFYDGSTELDTETLDGSGNATFAISSLGAGSHNLYAVYSGDDDFNTSSSDTGYSFTIAALTTSDTSFDVDENASLAVAAASGLLHFNNDSYLTLRVTAVNGNSANVGVQIATAEGGELTVNADGSFTYTPPADWTGDDTFTYTIGDGDGNTSTATVTLHVA